MACFQSSKLGRQPGAAKVNQTGPITPLLFSLPDPELKLLTSGETAGANSWPACGWLTERGDGFRERPVLLQEDPTAHTLNGAWFPCGHVQIRRLWWDLVCSQ